MTAHTGPGPRQRNQVGDWGAQAKCLGMDRNIFFPTHEDGTGKARAICAECPVQEDCLRHALDNHEDFGVWGGTTARQRRRIQQLRLYTKGGPLPPIPRTYGERAETGSRRPPKEPPPLCACGCGNHVQGYLNGVWSRYLHGHTSRRGRL